MAIPFAIEPSALTDSLGGDPRSLISLHKHLINMWSRYGVLVDPEQGESSITQIFAHEALAPVRKIWQDAWKASGRCRRTKLTMGSDIIWPAIESREELAKCHNCIQVALVEKVRGIGFLGIPDDDVVCNIHCGEVEAVLFPYIDESDKFADLAARTGNHIIRAGATVESIWEDMFEPLAKSAGDIALIDRYLSSPRNMEGLFRMLGFLSSESLNLTVKVYASNPNTMRDANISLQELYGRINDELNLKHCMLNQITVVLILDDAMTRDRYASFGGIACHFGHGLPELLSAAKSPEDTTYTVDPSPSGTIRIIRREIRRIEARPQERLEFTRGVDGAWKGTASWLGS